MAEKEKHSKNKTYYKIYPLTNYFSLWDIKSCHVFWLKKLMIFLPITFCDNTHWLHRYIIKSFQKKIKHSVKKILAMLYCWCMNTHLHNLNSIVFFESRRFSFPPRSRIVKTFCMQGVNDLFLTRWKWQVALF